MTTNKAKEVLILTGACGVGKSTISDKWATQKQGAVVECDYFTEWIRKTGVPDFSKEEEQLVARMSARVAIEYLEYGLPVAIENVWFPPGIQTMIDLLVEYNSDLSIKIVWLFCEREENHRRDRQRISENQMKERVDIVNGELAICDWPSFVTKINSTHLSLVETLQAIYKASPINGFNSITT